MNTRAYFPRPCRKTKVDRAEEAEGATKIQDLTEKTGQEGTSLPLQVGEQSLIYCLLLGGTMTKEAE